MTNEREENLCQTSDHLLTITATGKFGPRGEKYDIAYKGEIIASGHSPECVACRELQKRGLTGRAYFTRGSAPYIYDFSMPIDVAAKRTVSEGLRTGPRFAKWEPNPLFARRGIEEEQSDDDAVLQIEEPA